MKKKYYTLNEIQKKLEYYCSYQERCHFEVFNKIMKFNSNNNDANEIITKLIDDGYLNETRFSKEFTRGKFNHKNWGRIRIRIELKKRKISNKNIEIGLDELDENNYVKKFNELFQKQLDKQNHKIDMYSKKKIFNYFTYRGWENHMVFNKMNALK
tara:strand:- start:2392 stop:2859 length:468 start_codon:yes stop_codon:yes gene_type:complete